MLGDAILEVGIDSAEGELLSRVVAGLSEGIVLEMPIIAVVVEDLHAVLGGKCLEGAFAVPRNLSHRAEEAASALGWLDFRQLLGDFPVEGKLLELREGKVTEAVVPSHEFGLILGSGKVDVLFLLRWR